MALSNRIHDYLLVEAERSGGCISAVDAICESFRAAEENGDDEITNLGYVAFIQMAMNVVREDMRYIEVEKKAPLDGTEYLIFHSRVKVSLKGLGIDYTSDEI